MFSNLSYVSISFIYVNILGYVFHFYVSRKLAPSGYGEFMVLYSLMLTVLNVANIFNVVTVKTIVENVRDKEKILRFLRIVGIITGILLAILGAIFSPAIKNFLRISKLSFVWIVVGTWIVLFIIAVERGYLQAKDRFGIYAFSSALELTIRLLLAIVFLNMGYNISGAISSSLSAFVIILIFLLVINKNIFGRIKTIPLTKILKISAYASPAGFFVYLDDIFIKRIFSPELAGFYASSSILGRALILFSLTLFSVFFPKIVASETMTEFKKLCLKAIMLIVAIFIVSDIMVLIFGEKIFLLLFGAKFKNAFSILPRYIIAVLPLTISTVFIGINTAKEKYLSLIYLQLIIYILGFIILKFNNVYSYISYIFFYNFIFVFIYSYLIFFKSNKINNKCQFQ